MSAYLLDTSSLIAATKFGGRALDNLNALSDRGDHIAVCAITVSEYYSGIQRGMDSQWDRLVDLFDYWEISRATAELAGDYRWRFARMGRQLTVTDTLLAALARERGAILVTENLKDFPMDDLRVVSLAD